MLLEGRRKGNGRLCRLGARLSCDSREVQCRHHACVGVYGGSFLCQQESLLVFIGLFPYFASGAPNCRRVRVLMQWTRHLGGMALKSQNEVGVE